MAPGSGLAFTIHASTNMEFLGINNFWLFIVSSTLLILSPGIDTMLVMNRSMTNGKKTATYTIFGISAGIVFHTLLGAFGLSLILTKAAYLFTIIKAIGAVYLIYLGVMKLWKSKSAQLDTTSVKEKPSKSFTTGLITNVFNPKVALFFLAFFPQFIDPASQNTAAAFMAMGLIFILITFVWLLIVNLLVSYFTALLVKSPRSLKIIDRLAGVMFLGMGLKLALSSRN